MSAVSSIVLNDALATPVAHTFIPLGPDTNGVWWFEENLTTISPVGYNRISIQLVRASNPAPGASAQQRVARVKIGIHTPKLETVANNSAGFTPAPTVAYILRANIELLLPERSTYQDRRDIRKYVQFLMLDTQVLNVVELMQNIY
jgi:hypothetical protein